MGSFSLSPSFLGVKLIEKILDDLSAKKIKIKLFISYFVFIIVINISNLTLCHTIQE